MSAKARRIEAAKAKTRTCGLLSRRRAVVCFGWARRPVLTLAVVFIIPVVASIIGCHPDVGSLGVYAATDMNNCLPNLKLTDQHGRQVSLASLKGTPVLFDFIFTNCAGPCLMLTSRMRQVADQLSSMLGSKVWFVSVTVDPEHDGPTQLFDYAKDQGVERDGWLFLTGTPHEVERLMAQFNLQRAREADGTIEHVQEFFLVGSDGRQLRRYAGYFSDPTIIARDVEQSVQTDGTAR